MRNESPFKHTPRLKDRIINPLEAPLKNPDTINPFDTGNSVRHLRTRAANVISSLRPVKRATDPIHDIPRSGVEIIDGVPRIRSVQMPISPQVREARISREAHMPEPTLPSAPAISQPHPRR